MTFESHRLDLVPQLVKDWTSKQKVAGLIPTTVKHFVSLPSLDRLRVTAKNQTPHLNSRPLH